MLFCGKHHYYIGAVSLWDVFFFFFSNLHSRLSVEPLLLVIDAGTQVAARQERVANVRSRRRMQLRRWVGESSSYGCGTGSLQFHYRIRARRSTVPVSERAAPPHLVFAFARIWRAFRCHQGEAAQRCLSKQSRVVRTSPSQLPSGSGPPITAALGRRLSVGQRGKRIVVYRGLHK